MLRCPSSNRNVALPASGNGGVAEIAEGMVAAGSNAGAELGGAAPESEWSQPVPNRAPARVIARANRFQE
jgi:hypothetical protein